MLATSGYLDQNRLDDEEMWKSLIPPHKQSRSKLVFVPGDFLDNMSSEAPNQECRFQMVTRPQRCACHWLRKLVRALSGPERKAIRLLYYKGLSPLEVQKKMSLGQSALEDTLTGAFAKLREQLHPLLSQE